MTEIFNLLGIEHKRFEAIDGTNDVEMKSFAPLHFLPNYLDPYHKRPMKRWAKPE